MTATLNLPEILTTSLMGPYIATADCAYVFSATTSSSSSMTFPIIISQRDYGRAGIIMTWFVSV